MSEGYVRMRYKEILFATSNMGKVARARKLIKAAGIETIVHTPQDLGLQVIELPEDGTIEENAKQKARAYLGMTDMPILGTDTSLHIEGEDIDPLKPKRNALGDADESEFTKEKIAEKMVDFWQCVARKKGGRVDGYWYDFNVLVLPDGKVKTAGARRDIILTDTIYGEVDTRLPIRALYVSKVTGKPVQLQTPEEELIELKPIIDAYKLLLK